MSARLLVTGGAGLLGAWISRVAARAGWEVHATIHHAPASPDLPATTHVVDITDESMTMALVARVRPDALIHTAYRQRGPDLWPVTVLGSGHVARAAFAYDARLVHLSSDVIFDGEHGAPYTEQAWPAPISPYGAAKAAAEALVAALHPAAVIVRTSLIVARTPIDPQSLFALDVAAGRIDAIMYADEIRCPIAVEDLASAVLELAGSSYAGVLHVAGADAVSRYELARLVVASHGSDPAPIRAGPSPGMAGQRPRNLELDCALAGRILRFPPRGIRTVLGTG